MTAVARRIVCAILHILIVLASGIAILILTRISLTAFFYLARHSSTCSRTNQHACQCALVRATRSSHQSSNA